MTKVIQFEVKALHGTKPRLEAKSTCMSLVSIGAHELIEINFDVISAFFMESLL